MPAIAATADACACWCWLRCGGVRAVAMDVVGWEPVKMHVRKQMLGKYAEADVRKKRGGTDVRKIRGGRCKERRRKMRTQSGAFIEKKHPSRFPTTEKKHTGHGPRAENSKNKIEWDEKMKAGMLCRRRRSTVAKDFLAGGRPAGRGPRKAEVRNNAEPRAIS